MARKKKETDTEKLLEKQILELTKENQALRKKLSKSRKDANLSHDTLVSNQEYARQALSEEKKLKIKKCVCGGELRKFKIHNLEFEICQTCKARTRIIDKK